MRKSLVYLIALVSLISSACATVLDQSQEQSEAWLIICSEWSAAQTFTAGMSGQLEKIDLSLDNIFALDLYPATISIVNVINGVPSGSVLGSVYTENLVTGFNSIDFLSESIFLDEGTQYGIVLSDSDIDRYNGTSTQWLLALTDVYNGGSLWSCTDGLWTQTVIVPGGLAETFYDKDAVFRTYMVPEPSTVLLFALGGLLLRKQSV